MISQRTGATFVLALTPYLPSPPATPSSDSSDQGHPQAL